jgi:hypothetical protein
MPNPFDVREVMPDELAYGIEKVRKAMWWVLSNIGQFKILDESLVPQGLKPIARSISWLVEQIVVQNLREKGSGCGILSVTDPPHDLTQYDCILSLVEDRTPYHLNVKTSLTSTDASGRFDVSKAPKLVELYGSNPNLVLLVAIVKVEMVGVTVRFRNLIVFNVAWTSDIYYNRANHNLQATGDGRQTRRTNSEFVEELKSKMNAAGHLSHY